MTPPEVYAFRSPHGMETVRSTSRVFGGVTARHLQHFCRPGKAWHDLSSSNDTLTIVLAELGGQCEARARVNEPAALDRQRPNHISFVPADLITWGYSENIKSVRELRLTFDHNSLRENLGSEVSLERAQRPRLMFHDQRILQCAILLAEECDSVQPVGALYGESLTAALLSAFSQAPVDQDPGGLSSRQLRAVIEFIHAHLDGRASISDLSDVVGLSPSQFTRHFKRSTGMPLHRYQLKIRIEHAQHLLLQRSESLSNIAIATGFVDQSHFTRAFKQVTGATPNAWRGNRSS